MSESINSHERKDAKVKRRDESFSKKASTKIWREEPNSDNPYIADNSFCYGFSLLELIEKRSYVDVLYLLFRGDLPTKEQSQLLEKLLIACINPGPRHPAVRAAMNTGVGKTNPAHILPIGLMILGGDHLGAAEVESAVRWLRKNTKHDPQKLAQTLINEAPADRVGDYHIAPGFGSRFGSKDTMIEKLAKTLLDLPGSGKVMNWSKQFVTALNSYDMGYLSTGLVGAVFCDLGFQPRVVAGLFQLLCAPGILAHGAEQSSKPVTSMPFPDDADYFIEEVGSVIHE